MILFSDKYTEQIKEFFKKRRQPNFEYIDVGDVNRYFAEKLHLPYGEIKLRVNTLNYKISNHELSEKLLLKLPQAQTVFVFRNENSDNRYAVNIIYNIKHIENNKEGLLLVGIHYDASGDYEVYRIATIHRRKLNNIYNRIRNKWNEILYINKEALGTIIKGDSAGTEGFNEDSKKILTQIYDFIDKKVAGEEKFFPEHLQGLGGLPDMYISVNSLNGNDMGNVIKSKYAGWEAYAGKGAVNIRTAPGLGGQVLKTARNGESFGTVAGLWHRKVDGYTWYVIIPDFTTKYRYVYVASGYFKVRKKPVPTKSDTESLINKTLRNDINTMVMLSQVVYKMNLLHATGKLDSDTFRFYRSKVKLIADTVMRHQELINRYRSYFVIKDKVNSAIDSVKRFFGLSAVPVVALIAVTAVATVAITALLYYLFKPAYNESVVNLKVSRKLKKALDSLPESDRKEVLDDLERQIDDAYNRGMTDEKFAGMGDLLKYGLIAAGVVMVANKISE